MERDPTSVAHVASVAVVRVQVVVVVVVVVVGGGRDGVVVVVVAVVVVVVVVLVVVAAAGFVSPGVGPPSSLRPGTSDPVHSNPAPGDVRVGARSALASGRPARDIAPGTRCHE